MPAHQQKRPRGAASGSWDLDASSPPSDRGGALGPALAAEARAAGLELGDARAFERRFERCDVLGRGAFSVVEKLVDRTNGREYAVKTVDARPLRLRPNFSPKRLLREACILSRLRHPHVVGFVGVWAAPDALRLVLEKVAGRELFDVILERQALAEHDARPLLRQLCDALAYLHEHRIAHRDVKPENVLVDGPDDGRPARATLIDFGLSKALLDPTGDEEPFPLLASSVGKTFVGTPCYLAPEIEAIHAGGPRAPRSYGVQVDAWSFGAVINVSLVARFPEFDRRSDPPSVNVATAAFRDVSAEARDLVVRLMVNDPQQRLSTRDALAHPWFHASPPAAPPNAPARAPLRLVAPNPPAPPLPSLSPPPPAFDDMHLANKPPPAFDDATMHLVPRAARDAAAPFEVDDLLGLQQTIAVCLRSALATYADVPEVSRALRRSAVLCRSQLLENAKLLRKIESTATSVLDIHDDLELAVAAGRSALARELVATVKNWVGGLRAAVGVVQDGNAAQMRHLHAAISEVEDAARGASATGDDAAAAAAPPLDGYESDEAQTTAPDDAATAPRRSASEASLQMLASFDMDDGVVDEADAAAAAAAAAAATAAAIPSRPASPRRRRASSSPTSLPTPPPPAPSTNADTPPTADRADSPDPADRALIDEPRRFWPAPSEAPEPERVFELALRQLERVDAVLERLALLWGNTEVIFDQLLQKSEHIEKFLEFVQEPELMGRFTQRLAEYKKFWVDVHAVSRATLQKQASPRARPAA